MNTKQVIKIPNSFRRFQTLKGVFEVENQFPEFIWDFLKKAKTAPLTLKNIAIMLDSSLDDALLIVEQLENLGLIEEIAYSYVGYEQLKEKPKMKVGEFTENPKMVEMLNKGVKKNRALVEDSDISVKCSSFHNNRHAVHMVIE